MKLNQIIPGQILAGVEPGQNVAVVAIIPHDDVEAQKKIRPEEETE